MDTTLYNQEGSQIGSVTLKAELFGIEPNQYIVNLLARQRQGNSDSKTRKDVSGGGKKPWKQKGTGRARAGTIRSPLWRGGGIVFGPHPRLYGTKFPKKMKRLAIASVFSDKARMERIKVIDKIEMAEFKTKSIVAMLSKLSLAGKKCIILDEGRNEKLWYSCRNLPGIRYGRAALANGYELLHADYIVFTKAGLEKAEEVFA